MKLSFVLLLLLIVSFAFASDIELLEKTQKCLKNCKELSQGKQQKSVCKLDCIKPLINSENFDKKLKKVYKIVEEEAVSRLEKHSGLLSDRAR